MSSPAPLPKEILRSAQRGELQKVVKWLRKGGLVDARFPTERECGDTATTTLLNVATGNGHLAIVRELLKRGASVDLQNSLGGTALMSAAYRGYLSILLVLLQHSASPDLQDMCGHTALMKAAANGQEACVQALLRAKASTKLLDNDGSAALHHALSTGHMAVVELIRQHAAPPQPVTASPAAPPDAVEPAVSSARGEPSLPSEIFDSAARGELPEVVEWLGNGGLVDALCLDDDGTVSTFSSLLRAATSHGQLEMVRMLLKRGASVDLQCSHGIAALCTAARKGDFSILLVLLQHSANPDLQKNDGFTALMSCAAVNGHEACVKALLRAKANTKLVARCGHTALQFAEALGHTAIAELIRQHAAPPQSAPSSPAATLEAGEPTVSSRAARRERSLVEVELAEKQAPSTRKAKIERDAAAARRRDAAAVEAREAEAKREAKAEASMARRQKQAEERDQRRALMAESERLQLAQSQLEAAERSKALEERRAEQAAAEAQRRSTEERACKEEKRRCAEAKVAAKEAKAREELVVQQEGQLAAAREVEAQAARDRKAAAVAAAVRQRAKAEAQRLRQGEKARRHQQARAGRTDREPRCTSAPPLEHARAAAAPPPNAVLGDALALALNQHAGHNPRSSPERAPAECESMDLEEMLVRRAIALTSSLRVEAPVFVPALH